MATQEEHVEVMRLARPTFELVRECGEALSPGDLAGDPVLVAELAHANGYCAGVNDTLFCPGKRLDVSQRQKVWEVHQAWAEGYDDGVRAASGVLHRLRARDRQKRGGGGGFKPNAVLPIMLRRG